MTISLTLDPLSPTGDSMTKSIVQSDLRALFANAGLTPQQIHQLELRLYNEELTDIVKDLGYASDDTVATVLAAHYGYDVLTATAAREVNLQSYLSTGLRMDRHQPFIPLAWDAQRQRLTVAISRYQHSNDATSFLQDQFQQIGVRIQLTFVFASAVTIQSLYHRWFSHSDEALLQKIRQCDELNSKHLTDAEQLEANTSTRQLVYDLLRHAAYAGASDIHLEQTNKVGYILLRLDGVRVRFAPMSLATFNALVNVLRGMTNVTQENMNESLMAEGGLHGEQLKIIEQAKTNDQAAEIAAVLQRWNFRFQFGMAVSGNTITIRLNDGQSSVANFQHLGFKPEHQHFLEGLLASSDGLLIITGPTGSGKTTTLYAALQQLDGDARSIQSIERPVEFKDPRWRQYQIPSTTSEGDGGKKILKGLLRNDPDVILMGEARDQEAIELLLRASNTGHLVFSTFHTKTAPTALSQFREYRIRGEVIASELKAILAQRLVRRLCRHCRRPDQRASTLQALCSQGINHVAKQLFMASQDGCKACNHTGYRGRTMVYELLRVTAPVRAMIEQDAPISAIAKAAFTGSDHRMWAHGLEQVAHGVTSLDEIHANVPDEV